MNGLNDFAVDLSKAGPVVVDLAKKAPAVKKWNVDLRWKGALTDLPDSDPRKIDLDVSAFVLSGGRVRSAQQFVFYNNKSNAEGSVVSSGDNRGGTVQTDPDGRPALCEQLVVEYDKMNPADDEIVVTVTIHDAPAKGQNFGQIDEVYLDLVDAASGAVVACYPITDTDKFALADTLILVSLKKGPEGFELHKIEETGNGELPMLLQKFGLQAK